MAKHITPKKSVKPKRAGTAFWLSDTDAPLVRAIAAAEDRPIQTVLRRALTAYAAASPEYRARAAQTKESDDAE